MTSDQLDELERHLGDGKSLRRDECLKLIAAARECERLRETVIHECENHGLVCEHAKRVLPPELVDGGKDIEGVAEVPQIVEMLVAEVERLREKNTELNRRCQAAESVANEAAKHAAQVASHETVAPGSFGRALLAWDNQRLREANAELVAACRAILTSSMKDDRRATQDAYQAIMAALAKWGGE